MPGLWHLAMEEEVSEQRLETGCVDAVNRLVGVVKPEAAKQLYV